MAEIPENVLKPEYWDGHNPVGECRKEDFSLKELSNKYAFTLREKVARWLNIARYWRRATERTERDALDHFARKTLTAYLDSGNYTPIRRFREGETLVGSVYNSGTILGIEDESLTLLGNKPSYRKSFSYGVICDLSLVKVYPTSEDNDGNHFVLLKGKHVKEMWLHLPLLPGRVNHSILLGDHSKLTRCIQIDVLQQGIVSPEASQSKLIPTFNPTILLPQ